MFARYRWENIRNQRYYEVVLGLDLFGWCLTRIWGRKGSALGQVVHRPCLGFDDGKHQIMLIDKQRQRKGYAIVSSKVFSFDKECSEEN